MGSLYYILILICFSIFIFGLRNIKLFSACLLFSLLNIPNFSPYYFTLIISCLSFFLLIGNNIEHSYFKKFTMASFSIFITIIVINILAYSRNHSANELLSTLGKLLQAYFIVGTLLSLIKLKGIIEILRTLCYVFFISIILGFIQLFTLSYLFNYDYPFYARFSFLAIPDSNYSGLYLIFFLCILSYLCQIKKADYLLIFSFLLCIIAVVFTLSRTTFIVCGVIFILHFQTYIVHNRFLHTSNMFQKLFVLLCFGIFIFISWNFFIYDLIKPYINEYIQYTSDFNSSRLTGQIDTFKLRVEIWRAVFKDLSLVDTIMGKGDITIPEWNHTISGHYMTIHNFPITLLVKYGFIAPLIYFFFIFKITIKKISFLNSFQYFIMIIGIGYFIFTLTVSDEIGFFILLLIGLYCFVKDYKGIGFAKLF
jgi:hypothetical protein